MFRRVIAVGIVLGFATIARADAVLSLSVSDMGTVDEKGNRVGWAPVTELQAGNQYMVHATITSNATFTSGARTITLDPTGPGTTIPYDWLGTDIDTVNQPPDGRPNFWFDYTKVSTFQGRFPAAGLVDVMPPNGVYLPSTAGYTDYSNLLTEALVPSVANTTWATSTAGPSMFFFNAGVPVHVGALVINVPADAVMQDYTIDLLNPTAVDMNTGARIQYDFNSPTDLWVNNPAGAGRISYGTGGGPLPIHVVPEPATLLLLGLGGVAVLRRRR
jgi:hypothetical protein